ncbi:MAG: hypothetical protein P1V20_09710 [Verrucomicrobiales bacterium]|nr:hypothetical protein [Verrucomicrobiales bacterium]
MNEKPCSVYSYVVTTEGREIAMYQRTIYLEGCANEGFRLFASIDEEDSRVDLAVILLEDAMSSEIPGDPSTSEHIVDGFGHALGGALARRMIERSPNQSALEQKQLALAGIVRSLNSPYTEEEAKGFTQYRFDQCPLCDASKRTGIEHVDLAHHALYGLLKTTIRSIDPDSDICAPRDKSEEHIFSLL